MWVQKPKPKSKKGGQRKAKQRKASTDADDALPSRAFPSSFLPCLPSCPPLTRHQSSPRSLLTGGGRTSPPVRQALFHAPPDALVVRAAVSVPSLTAARSLHVPALPAGRLGASPQRRLRYRRAVALVVAHRQRGRRRLLRGEGRRRVSRGLGDLRAVTTKRRNVEREKGIMVEGGGGGGMRGARQKNEKMADRGGIQKRENDRICLPCQMVQHYALVECLPDGPDRHDDTCAKLAVIAFSPDDKIKYLHPGGRMGAVRDSWWDLTQRD